MERRTFLGLTASLGVPHPHVERTSVPRMKTGVAALDQLLGGGYPCGHFTLVDGMAGSLVRQQFHVGIVLNRLRLVGAKPSADWYWVPTRTAVEDAIAAAIKANGLVTCTVGKDSRLEEYLGWFDGVPVPVILEGWIARDPEIREVLHRRCSVELLAEKYMKGAVVQHYVRVVADRIQGRMGPPYNFESRPPDPRDGTTCEFDQGSGSYLEDLRSSVTGSS